MDPVSRFALLLMLLLCGLTANDAYSSKDDFETCESTVMQWASSSLLLDAKEDGHILKDLLFFLHVPRTGGRTYFQCFLKKLYTSSLECPRSYDKLRFDPSKPNCRLVSTHDDYSMMSKLTTERTSVVTILRNPVDRVFSIYEFSIEVAARFLVHANLTSVTRMSGRLRSKTGGMSTLDIWPWKYLVPWMREDLFARRDARIIEETAYTRSSDPYDMEEIVMPLHEYINDPIALDIVHNGATFQVAGLTNNSYLDEAHEVRHCVKKYENLGKYVLEVAKKRLDDMLYVGLTEDHRKSATMFANVVGAQVISQLVASSSVQNSSDSKSDASDHLSNEIRRNTSTEKVEASNQNMTVRKLIEAYEACTSGLRRAQAQRRNASLKRISPANFTKEARLRVPKEVLEEIISLNNLDMEIYKYSQDIFKRQYRIMEQQKFDSLSPERQLSNLTGRYGAATWRVVAAFVSSFFLLFFIFLFVKGQRRSSKIKM